jgi:hypothetical protein
MSSEIGLIVMPTPCCWRKAVSGAPLCEVCSGSPESLARGMLIKGLPVNPGELPAPPLSGHLVAPNPKTPGLRGVRAAPARSERPSSGVSCGQGKPEAQVRAGEQSYDSIVPMKVENRRAPEKGRPRHPLEGRDEQVDVSVQCHRHETLNSGRHVKWT